MMAITRDHELHKRRLGRNVGVGLALVAFIMLVFGLTVAKVQRGGSVEGYDHGYRPGMDPAAQETTRGEE
ncbi:MAG: hypothetical protein HLUCCA12_02625 [Rhodobacteraceae bacterium HLUCCA12]|nr:MAG: hypothetical protein HLUCCA12_02625 [Rhodobacteraceae bacterium HLUCCA12]